MNNYSFVWETPFKYNHTTSQVEGKRMEEDTSHKYQSQRQGGSISIGQSRLSSKESYQRQRGYCEIMGVSPAGGPRNLKCLWMELQNDRCEAEPVRSGRGRKMPVTESNSPLNTSIWIRARDAWAGRPDPHSEALHPARAESTTSPLLRMGLAGGWCFLGKPDLSFIPDPTQRWKGELTPQVSCNTRTHSPQPHKQLFSSRMYTKIDQSKLTFSFPSTEAWTQGLIHARQAPYHRAKPFRSLWDIISLNYPSMPASNLWYSCLSYR